MTDKASRRRSLLRHIPARLMLLGMLVLLGALPTARAVAEPDRLQAVRAAGVLRVGTTGDYKPFSFRDPATGEWLGADIEMARDLAISIGVRLVFVPTTWPALLRDLVENRFDVAMGGVTATTERAQQAFFSSPYLTDGKTPITRCENAARFQTLQQIDRRGVRLIVNPGGTNERFARDHFKHAAIRVHADNLTIFDEIVAGRADLMVTDAIEARLQQRLRPALCAIHPQAPFDTATKVYLLPRDAAFKSFVDDWLRQRIASGRANHVLDRWVEQPWPVDANALHAPLQELLQMIDARLALMPDVARYKWNTGAAIEDVPREQEVLRTQGREAALLGLRLEQVEPFLRAQIEASKQLQRELFARWQEQKIGRFEQVPDLARDIRPQLDALTSRMLRALAVYARSHAASPVAGEELGALTMEGVSPTAVQIAVAPLRQARADAPSR